MANGFCPAVLTYMDYLDCANPTNKVTAGGYLQMLLNQPEWTRISPLGWSDSGHTRPVNVAFTPRYLASQTSTANSCDVNVNYGEQEVTVPNLAFHRQFSLYFDNTTMKQFCDGAMSLKRTGGTAFPSKVYDALLKAANAIVQGIDVDLLNKQAINFGSNQTTGTNASKTINFPLSTATNNLSEGWGSVLTDMQFNEVCKPIHVVGSGLVQNLLNQQAIACCNAAGIDISKISMNFYPDFYAATQWGANQFGIFEEGTVQLLTYNKSDLFNAGGGMTGTSQFGTIPLMVACPGCNGDYKMLKFDVQTRFLDCPQTININGVPTAVQPGWQVILSLDYDLFFIPATAYQATDRLFQNNGTYRYTATNV